MAQSDRVDSNQDFLHQQAQDLLSYCGIEHFCAYSQFAAKTCEALRPLQSAALSRPNYFPAHYNLGNAFASLGRLSEAIHEFEIAARLDPSDSMAETNWGAALAETGELSAAREHLKRAVLLDSKNSLARQNLEEVERRLSSTQSQ